MDLAPSQEPLHSLGRYELLFRIASGGMAEVYAARVRGEAGFQKLVAVKRMLPQLADDEEFVTMFLDEARVAANINSPNCVATQDLGRAEDGSLYIVMELVVGVTLARILRWSVRARRPVPLRMAVELLGQAAHGLHDAHVATTPLGAPLQIVHRDVSPQNVLVGVDGRVRLTDFGVARAVLRITQTVAGQIKGKSAYCSPEQLLGQPMDQRADVFSLGVVAWELFAGQRLFVGEHPMETMERVRSMPIPALHQIRADVPQGVSDVVATALERDRDQRLESAKEFEDRLRAAAAQAGIQAPAREDKVRFIHSAGGETLGKIRENIRRALSNQGGMQPEASAAAVGLTPSGVQSSIQQVPTPEHDPTDPTSGAHDPAPEPDASVPSIAANPSSFLPTAFDGIEVETKRRSPLPFVMVGLVALIGVAGGAIYFVSQSSQPQVESLPTTGAPGSDDTTAITETPQSEQTLTDLSVEQETPPLPGEEADTQTEGDTEADSEATVAVTPMVRPRDSTPRGMRGTMQQQTMQVETMRTNPVVAQTPMHTEMGMGRTPTGMGAMRGTTGLVTSGSIDWGN